MRSEPQQHRAPRVRPCIHAEYMPSIRKHCNLHSAAPPPPSRSGVNLTQKHPPRHTDVAHELMLLQYGPVSPRRVGELG
jgi:hypothetical protein